MASRVVPRDGAHQETFLAQEAVDERGLAHVGTPQDRHPDARSRAGQFLNGGQVLGYGLQQVKLVSFNQLKVNLDYLPLFRNEIFVKNISLDDPFIEILQNGVKFNFSDLTASDTAAVVKDTVPAAPMKYDINNIKINRGYVKYTDIPLNHTIELNKLDLLIPGFIWNSDSQIWMSILDL